MLRSFRAEEPRLTPQSESGFPPSHPRPRCTRASIAGLSDPWTPESTAAKNKPGRSPSWTRTTSGLPHAPRGLTCAMGTGLVNGTARRFAPVVGSTTARWSPRAR
jgi:hypothetical protein